MARIWVGPDNKVMTAPTDVSEQVIKVGADEAEEILAHQGEVHDLPSLEVAEAVQRELKRRGIKTRIVAEVGPPAPEPRTWAEQRLFKELGVRPGVRALRYGLAHLGAYRSKQRLLGRAAVRVRPHRRQGPTKPL